MSLRALVAAGFTLLVSLPAQATNIERIVSPGGIEAWVVRDSTVPLVTVDFSFNGGSSQDPADRPGVANIMVSMLDEGAGELDAKAFHERLEDKAIEFGMRAGRDTLRGNLRTLAENKDEAFELLRLALNAPRFDAEPLERIRAQVISGLRRETTSPNEIASRRWWEAAYPEHPYSRSVNGTPESVAAITTDDLRAFSKRILARDQVKIGIVGDIDIPTVHKLLDTVFGTLPVKANLRGVPNVPPKGAGKRIVAQLDVPQSVVIFGGAGIARKDPDFMAAYVTNHILGGGSFSSRLYREVRDLRGLAYSVYSSLSWMHNSAIFIGSTATRADRTLQAIELIEAEIKRMANEGPTEKELAEAKSYLSSSFALGLDTSGKIAGQLVQMQLDDLGIDYIDRRAKLIDAVTIVDAKRAAKRVFGQGLLVTVVGRPDAVAGIGPAN